VADEVDLEGRRTGQAERPIPRADIALAAEGLAVIHTPSVDVGQPDRAASRRPDLTREALLLLGLFIAYRLGRIAVSGHDDLAISNADWLWDFERFLHLPSEETMQDWALHWPSLVRSANWYYVGVHFPATLAFLIWYWWKRPAPEYRWARQLIIVITALALVLHVAMPLAPPRMLTGLGFLDTMNVLGPTAYGENAGTVANQFAAMPSLHVGWALLIAVVVVRTLDSPWRWLIVAHPIVTMAVVVVTANHYWMDGIVAGLLLGLALLVTARPPGIAPVISWRGSRLPATA
jgi:hypothetical protein